MKFYMMQLFDCNAKDVLILSLYLYAAIKPWILLKCINNLSSVSRMLNQSDSQWLRLIGCTSYFFMSQKMSTVR